MDKKEYNQIEERANKLQNEADAVKARCYCRECKREIKLFLYNGEEQEQPEEQPEGWKARMLEKFQKRV